jgi:putative ABC transport system ATP-binding protein
MSANLAHAAAPLISLDAACKHYGKDGNASPALAGVTLSIGAGEYVAVLGKSGSGKSTLLNLIAGLDRATSGSVCVGGQPLASLGESAMAKWRGRTAGVVFQFFQLLPTLTVVENIMLAMELLNRIPAAQRRDRALSLLRQVSLEDQAHKLPAHLSGGQQQRAAIARALANDPPLLLADEPTGNLDSQTAADVNQLFLDLAAQGKTLFVVTHDTELARSAHRVIELRDGRVVRDSQNSRIAA